MTSHNTEHGFTCKKCGEEVDMRKNNKDDLWVVRKVCYLCWVRDGCL